MVILILIVLGLCLGSFVNALVWRLHAQAELEEKGGAKKKDLSISKGRSMCTHCHHSLAPMDLVPVVSFLWLRGKCRYCHKPIQDTPLAELITPLLFVLSYIYWPEGFEGKGLLLFVLWLVFVVGFVALALYDLRWFLLPDKIVFPLIVLAFAQTAVVAVFYGGGLETIMGAFLGVAIGSGIFYLLFQYSRGKWIGGGDVKLGIVLGLLAASAGHAFLIIFVASLIGTLVALPLLATGRASRTSQLPFGPYLLAATVVVVLFGDRLISWYTKLFVA